jgi:hypothetical protein
MRAIYGNLNNETLILESTEQGGQFYLELEKNIRVPMRVRVNDVSLGLTLLMDGLNLEERIEYLNHVIIYLDYSEFEALLNWPGFRAACTSGFATATWRQVSDFCEQLNQVISARTGTEYEFKNIEIEPFDYGRPADS